MERKQEFPIEELGEIAELPADHPRRSEFERSPRGRALLASYRSFTNPGAAEAEAGLEQARAHLQSALARELDWDAQPSGAPGGSAKATGERRPSRRSWTWRSVLALRPVLAYAVIVIVVAGTWVAMRRPARIMSPSLLGGESTPVMRGHEVGATASVTLLPVRALPAGLELRWESVAGADRYEVEFFASDLTDLAHATPTLEPRLVLSLEALPAGLMRGTAVLWQVSAWNGRTPVARSETAPLRIP